MHLLVSSTLTSPLTDPFHSPLSPLSFCPSTRLSPLPPTITPPFSLPLKLSSPPSPSLSFSTGPLLPSHVLPLFFFQPCTSLSLLSSCEVLRFVFFFLSTVAFFHGFSIRISFSTRFSNFFPPGTSSMRHRSALH